MKTIRNLRKHPAKRARTAWTVAALLLGSTTALLGQSTTVIYNLNVPWSQPGIGNIEAVLAGTGFGVGFSNGATNYSVNSVTVELIGTSLPSAGFGLHFYSFVPGITTQFQADGALGNPVVSPTPTLWPGQTSFITFTPTTPITMAPNTDYLIGATEDTSGNNGNGLLFAAIGSAYTVAGGVQMFTSNPGATQWTYDQSSSQWSVSSGAQGALKVELDVTPVPEPSVCALVALGGAVIAGLKLARNKRCRGA